MKTHSFDVVIIGSGAGGGTTAWALSSQGIKVLVLEAGPEYQMSEYRHDKPDWEQTDFPERALHRSRYTFGQMQQLEARWDHLRSWNHNYGRLNPTNYRRAYKYHHARGLGGSTLKFAAEAHRIDPQSMKLKTLFGVAEDWPLSYEELEPYYTQAEYLVGVAGPASSSQPYRSKPFPLPPHPLSFASQKVNEASLPLGIHFEASPVAILSRPWNDRPSCNYCAGCKRGCPRGDKGSVDVTFLRAARKNGNCTIKADCQVTFIEATENDRVSLVHYVDGNSQSAVVEGKAVILSAGAVESPRLLLASQGPNSREGLANESGEVGKNFMESLSWASSGLHPEQIGSHRGIVADSIAWDYSAPDAVPGIVGGCHFVVSPTAAGLQGPISYAQRVAKGWGHAHKEEVRNTHGRALTIGAIGEFLPNKKSYIELDPEEKDHLNMPLARINSFVEEDAIQRIDFLAKKSREILYAVGVESIFEEYSTYDFFSAAHVFGTCRMGGNPSTSVVDSYCRSHRWRNLFIIDASVFPSSGGGLGPSLTVEALAIRAANNIRDLANRNEL